MQVPPPHAQMPLFPDAPAGVESPNSVKDVAALERKQFIAKHGIILAVWGLVAAAASLLILLSSPVGGVVTFVLTALVPLVILLVVMSNRARKSYWTAYASARGISLDEGGHIGGIVPLLNAGDEREYPFVLRGRVYDTSVQFGLYTYTEIRHTTDSEGRHKTERQDYDFTVAAFQLPDAVGARFAGVYVRPKSFKLGLGGLQDKFGHDEEVKLESGEFHKKHELRAWDAQDKIALFELFSTTFIDQLNTDLNVFWEQVGHNLVVYRKKHISVASELDDLVSDAWRVYRRYCEEYQ